VFRDIGNGTLRRRAGLALSAGKGIQCEFRDTETIRYLFSLTYRGLTEMMARKILK
jgi:hypothetical protein